MNSSSAGWGCRIFGNELDGRAVLTALVGAALLAILPPLAAVLLRARGHLQTNFRGDRIPQSFGLVIMIWAACILGLTAALFRPLAGACATWSIAVIGFGLLGLADDLWGDRTIKGLRAHFRAAFVSHRVTTGFTKAVGGLALAGWIGMRVAPSHLPVAALDAVVIALSANMINLLDLRPGRAAAAFLTVSVPLLAAGRHSRQLPLLAYAVIPTLPAWWLDSRAHVMMGDAGSNLLGACLGLGVALYAGIGVTVGALVALFALHVLAERMSITTLIEKQPLLNKIDRWTGAR